MTLICSQVISCKEIEGFPLTNPYQIKSFRGAYSNRKQKNGVIDSIIIANFLSFNGINQTSLLNKVYLL